MSFYHVLPSNSSMGAFPENTASSYRTTVATPYRLEGDWEVAVMALTHSNCINTFNNDLVEIQELIPVLTKVKSPTEVEIEWSDASKKMAAEGNKVDRSAFCASLVKDINATLRNIIEFKIAKTGPGPRLVGFVSFKFLNTNFGLVFDETLITFLRVADVITPGDEQQVSHDLASPYMDPLYVTTKKCHVTVIPLDKPQTEIILKRVYETIDISTLCTRFMDSDWLANELGYSMTFERKKNNLFMFENAKFGSTVKSVVLLNDKLQKALQMQRRGMYRNSYGSRVIPSFTKADTFNDLWTVQIFLLHRTDEPGVVPIHLPSTRLETAEQACAYLTKYINNSDVVISYLSKEQCAQLEVKRKGITLRLSKDVSDIFAFDKTVFAEKGVYRATGAVSLNRRINYFYIYSNIGEFVRIGDTEAPLLAVTAFNPKQCHFLSEIVFKRPFYIGVKPQLISQIDIGIYDDAGQLVPFSRDAITSLRLHFRRRRHR